MSKHLGSNPAIRTIRSIVIGLILVVGTLTPALAAFHLMTIQEVFVGPPSDMVKVIPALTPDQRAQYVMLRMTTSGETFLTGGSIRVEDASGNILGKFGTFTAGVGNGGGLGCSYPNCPAVVIGTTAAQTLLTVGFDQIVNGQANRVALPVSGGRACYINGTSLLDCVAWGNFSCTAANCPGGPNAFHGGDFNGNSCAANFGTPAAPGGLQFGKSLTRSTFNCLAKNNSTDCSLQFPKPVNNDGANVNTDSDSDGLVDTLDCNSANSSVQWAPIEVQHVTVSGHPTSTDCWDSESAFVGTGVIYDEVRGLLSHIMDFVDASCFNEGTASTCSTDASIPLAGDGYYYLVRAEAGPGCVGTFGKRSNGTSRDPQLAGICP